MAKDTTTRRSTAERETQTIASEDVGEFEKETQALMASRGDWVDLPIGFDPYWNPEVGKSFVGRVAEFDARDPSFVRIRFITSERLLCQKGDAEHAEDIWVEAGGFFSISVYAGIAKELMYHYQSGLTPEIFLHVLRKDKVKTGANAGKDVWIFGMKTRPEDQKRLAAGRADYFKQLSGGTPRPQLDGQTAPATA